MDKQGNLVDVRFQKDIEAYAEWQAGNRQLNTEYLEFQKMKAHYAGREEEMPYKTLAGFRRARRADDLSPAFKKWRYRKRDAKQYEEWKAILGAENMPEDVDKFQEIKYNRTNEYEGLQQFTGYKQDNPDSTFEDYQKAQALKANGVRGKIRIPPQKIDTAKYEYDDNHINKQRNHLVKRSDADSYIQNSVTSITKWNGEVIQYFSPKGATYINVKTKKIVTAFKSEEFDDNAKKILEEVLGNGKQK